MSGEFKIKISDKVIEFVRKELGNLESEVNIYVQYTQISDRENELLNTIRRIVENYSNGKVRFRIYSLGTEKLEYEPLYWIEKENIQYCGNPVGYEFGSFISTIKNVSVYNSTRDYRRIKVSDRVYQTVLKIDKILDERNSKAFIDVLTTPSCIFCPMQVIELNKVGIISRNIIVRCIDVTKFSNLVEKYSITGVPSIVINDNLFRTGVTPTRLILQKLLSELYSSNVSLF